MEIPSSFGNISLMRDRRVDKIVEPMSQGPALLRFVALPTDTERSSETGVVVASSTCVRLEQPQAPLDGAKQGQLLAALVALLHRYSQQTNVALDVFVRGGPAERATPVDADITAGASVASLTLELGLDQIGNARNRGADIGAPANVAATLHLAAPDLESLVDLGVSISALPASYDVNFVIGQIADSIVLVLIYNARLVGPAAINRLIESYVLLIGAALRDPSAAIAEMPLLSAAEVRALTLEQDGGIVPYPATPVHRLFEVRAALQPAATACSFHDETISYARLDERSNQLAHHLIACGVGAEVPVAVCVRPSIEMVVAVLAIWKARGIYIPLDPTHPEAFIARLLEESRPRLVLTTAALSGLTARSPQFLLDADAAQLAGQPLAAPANETAPADTAYILYTSGTTGNAKGVVATHANLIQYVNSAANQYGFCASDVFISLARYTFVISMFEVLSPLCCGGSLRILDRDEVLSPERLSRALEEVTVIHAGPSLLGSLFRYLRTTPGAPRALPGVRHVSSGGDLVPPSVIEEMKRVFTNAELFIIYGCTEVSCMGTSFPVARDIAATRNFVGKPFPNVAVRVLDGNRNLVPCGVVGEICFTGAGVVKGYLHLPELSAEKFAEIDGHRFYRTGDIGRLSQDGNLEILGRRDFQVQLRGIRIELPNIEKKVLELGLAVQCAVIAKTTETGDARLVAFIVKPSDEALTSFRRALAKVLPDYMLPHHVVVLDAMPLTANGKLDRNKLKELPWDRQLASETRVAPANPREARIAEVFARVLGLEAVGAEDNFFDLGGDSLLGVLLLEEIEHAIGVAIPPHVLFEAGTVRAIAEHPVTGGAEEARPILINARSSAPRLFMLSGIHIYRELARRLDGVFSAYGVAARHETEAFDVVKRFYSVEELAEEYIRIIRREQPHGPYHLLGYSYAGLAAYDVARQLREAGEEIRFLALVDPDLEWVMGWRFRLSQLGRLLTASPRDVFSFIRRRFLEKSGAHFHGFLRYREHKKLAQLEEQRNAVNRAASAQYFRRIRPWDGNVMLITAGARLANEPLKGTDCGWGRYIRSLEIHSVDADHFRMMSDDPYVSEIAEIMKRDVQRGGSAV